MNKFLWFLGGAAACFGGLSVYAIYKVGHQNNDPKGGGKDKNVDKTPRNNEFYSGIGKTGSNKKPSNIF